MSQLSESAVIAPGSSFAPGRGRGGIRRPIILGEVLVVLMLLRAYDLIREHAQLRTTLALRNGFDLLHAEDWLHLDLEHAVNHWTSLHRAVSLMASYWYQFLHVSVTLIILLWCYWRRPSGYRRARNALVLTNVFGLAFFVVFPAAPPRFLPGAGFVDAVANAGFGPSHGGPVTADQYGAFPSLHLAWAVWAAAVAALLVRRRWLRWLWLGYPLVTAGVVIATGNHYVLDVLGGVLIALVCVAVAYRYPRSREYGTPGPGSAWLYRLLGAAWQRLAATVSAGVVRQRLRSRRQQRARRPQPAPAPAGERWPAPQPAER